MSATAPQTSQKPLPKVLRIGIAQEQKIVQERLMKIGESVTVGENTRNSFVLPGTKLPPRFEMFVPNKEGYFLNFPEWMEGKISWKDGIRGLDELRQRGDAVKKGEFWQVSLNENVRGKVTIGGSTLLFQFVPAPPEPVRAVSPSDFRPKFFDDDDPLFQGLLAVFSLVAGAFMVWVYTTPRREHLDLDTLEAAADLVVVERVEIPPETTTTEEAPTEKTPEKTPEKKPEEKAESKAPKNNEPATQESVKEKSILLQMIGTVGNTDGRTAAEDILGDDAQAMQGIDAALNGVTGVQEANAGNIGAKSGSGTDREGVKVGVGIATGGNAATGQGAAVKIKKPKVEYGDVDADAEEGDVGGISSVVKKNAGRIATCLDQALKQDQGLNGRVSAGWRIVGGKVSDAHLVKNTTGNAELGQCVVRAVRSFRFDDGLTAEVAEYPWVVSGQ